MNEIAHEHLLLWGELDGWIPLEHLQEMAHTLPACRVVRVTGVGHSMNIEQPAPGKLILDGEIAGKKIRIESTLFDHTKWNMVSTRFRWVQDTPFNR